jgi:hypothetical protein
MGHKWIIAVLADLRTYAELNDLTRLAASLEEVEREAEEEIALTAGGAPLRALVHGAGSGTLPGTAGGGA